VKKALKKKNVKKKNIYVDADETVSIIMYKSRLLAHHFSQGKKKIILP
jgi:hypothetical protein